MTNYSLLAQAKLLKMVEEYVALTVRGEKCEPFTGGCLVQVTSTNPFEISDSSNYMRVKNPNRILEELKTVNSNINLPSIKGALIFLQKWNFECQYFSATDELRFDIIIEEVKYMDGIGTAEIIMDTVFLLDDASLKKKFKRLKKYLVAQEFNTSHPIDNAISTIEAKLIELSEKKRQADLKAQTSFHTTINPLKDPFYVSDNDCYPGKASISKSQMSQNSDFELLSLNSATEARYGSVSIKPSVVKKPYYSHPGPDMFSLNLDLLSSQPLLQKIQIDDDMDNGKESVKSKAKLLKKDDDMSQNNKHIEIMELEEISEEAYGVHKNSQDIEDLEDLEDRVSEDPAEDEDEEVVEEEEEEESKGKETSSEEASEKENVIEEPQKGRGQKLKRNFHEMIEQNKNSALEFPQQDLKKGKYQWGLNHRNEQQEFRKQIEGRKSLVQTAPDTDTLQLLASQFWNKEQSSVEENKESEEEEEGRGFNEGSMGVNKAYHTTLQPYVKQKLDHDDDESSDYSNSRGIEQRYNMDHKKKKMENSMKKSVERPVITRRVDVVESRQSSGNKSREPERVYRQIKNHIGARTKEPEINSSFGKGQVQIQKKILFAPAAVMDNRKKDNVIEIERSSQYQYRETTRRQTDEVVRNLIREREALKKQNAQERREYTYYRENDLAEDLLDIRDRELAKKEKYIQFGREYKKIDSMASQMAKSALQEEKARLAAFIDLTREDTIQKARRASNKGMSVSNYVVPGEKRRQASPNDITNYTDPRKMNMNKSMRNSVQIIQEEREFKRVANPLDPTKSLNISDFRDITLKPKKGGAANGGSKNLKQNSKKFFEIV